MKSYVLDTSEIRKMFPIYNEKPDLVYMDSGATSLKPQCVLDKMLEYYTKYGVNIHRGVYELSYRATEEYDIARATVSRFINCDFEEVVFTKNASDSLNLVALTYGDKYLQENDVVITSELEHHSSVLPWMKMCEKKKAILKYIPLNEEGRITVEAFKQILTKDVKVVALTYVSNVMGYITPIKEIIKLAHEVGAIVIVDAAQAVAHMKIDVKELDADFLGFSSHKMLGPTGLGVLYGKKKILNNLDPLEYGGDMNEEVGLNFVEVKDIPYRFETGTPAIAEVIGLTEAIKLLEKIGLDNIERHSMELKKYTVNELKKIDGIKLYNETAETPIISFNIEGVHPHDAATIFDNEQICLRAGHHCAQLITKWLHCVGTLRGSFYLYNDYKDADKFIETAKKASEFFRKLNG